MNETESNTSLASGGWTVERKLARARWRQRTFVDVRGLIHVFLWAAVLLAADFAIDWSFKLSGRDRLILLGLNLVILAFVARRHWLRYLRRADPARTALEVENHHPQLKSLLVSYVQLRDVSGRRNDGISTGMIQAMRRQAVEATRPIDFGKIVRFRTLTRLFACCVAVILVGGLAGWREPELLSVFAGRMVNPRSTLRYPTRTILWPVTADATLQEGQPFTPAALASGEIPTEGILIIRPADGDVETVRIPAGKEVGPDGRREFAYPMTEVYRSFTYSFRLGDAVSDRYKVTVVPPPRVAPQVTVTYPPYTNRPPRIAESLTLEVLEGSQIEWTVKFDRPLAVAAMVRDADSPLPMELLGDGRTARLTLGRNPEPLTKTLQYGFRWTDRDNGFTYAPAARHTVQVVPDRPPRVTITAPSGDLKGTVDKELQITVVAKDDYGLSSARLVYSVDASADAEPEEFEAPIETRSLEKQPPEVTLPFSWNVIESIPDLKPGDVVRYAVEITDNRPDKPWTARSEMRRLTIVTREEYVRYAAEERTKILARVRELQAEERRAAQAVKDLKDADEETEK